MNIIIINGSPRKKGLISQMLDIMREEAETKGNKKAIAIKADFSWNGFISSTCAIGNFNIVLTMSLDQTCQL